MEIGLPSWDDEQEILRYLHHSKQVTFFTRDLGFFRYRLCHKNYCLVVIEMAEVDAASSILRFLRHPAFKTKSQRCGKVIKRLPHRIAWWEYTNRRHQNLIW